MRPGLRRPNALGPAGTHRLTELPSGESCGTVDRLGDVATARLGVDDRIGEQPPGQLVVARRQGDVELERRTAVHLGGSAGARAGAAAETLVVDIEEAVLGQPVEVVGGDAALDARSVGGLVPPDPVTRQHDVVVERASAGLTQNAEGSDLVDRGRLLRSHDCQRTSMCKIRLR